MAHPLQLHLLIREEREKKQKNPETDRSGWLQIDIGPWVGGFSSAWPCVVVGRGWPSVLVASSGLRVRSDRRGSRVVGQTSLSSTLPPSHWAIDYTNEAQKSPASPPHALPLDQPHFSPFVVINNGGIDWISGFYFFGFLGFIFLVFLGFIFLGFISLVF